jgi:hypothetical protein
MRFGRKCEPTGRGVRKLDCSYPQPLTESKGPHIALLGIVVRAVPSHANFIQCALSWLTWPDRMRNRDTILMTQRPSHVGRGWIQEGSRFECPPLHQEVRASDGGFPASEIIPRYRELERRASVCANDLTRFRYSGRQTKIRFPNVRLQVAAHPADRRAAGPGSDLSLVSLAKRGKARAHH